MTIITQHLAERLPLDHELLLNPIVNPLKYSSLYSNLQNRQQLTIYDATQNKKLEKWKIIGVKDHINRTGSNPLIGSDKTLPFNFIDISNLYRSEKHFVVTDCCGKTLNSKYQYPSYFLCHVSILARAMKIQKIKAYLVNIK